MMRAKIIGAGHYAPERRVTNAELEKRLSLSDGWIMRRTGISERRYAADGEAVTDLAWHAAKAALEQAEMPASKIGLLLLATSTPDHLLPPSAPLLAHRLGCANAGAIDLAGACTGFVYALALADSFVRVHGTSVLVVAANILSRRINPDDPGSSVLFGDGAGAVILSPAKDDGCGLIAAHLSSQGAYYDLLKIEAGGSRRPFTPETSLAERTIKLSSGRTVFATAVASMVKTSRAVLESARLSSQDIDWWIPHQANKRIIDAARQQLDLAEEKTLYSLEIFGNSSAATIPLTLSLHWSEGRFRQGDRLLLTAVGAGFTEGAIIYRI